MTKRFLTVFLLSLMTVGLTGRAEAARKPDSIAAYFAPRPVGHPQGLDRKFIAFVDKAERTLDGAFYDIDHEPFVDAFVRAADRGVRIRLVIDDGTYYARYRDGSPDTSRLSDLTRTLRESGIQVRMDNGRSALMHNKFAIIDGKHVWTGSFNLTGSYARNWNNALEIGSRSLAKVYSQQFREMYSDGHFDSLSPSTPWEQMGRIGETRFEVLFAPEDRPGERVLEILAGARHSIHFMQFAFTSDAISDLLVEMKEAGVEVSGIVDHTLYRSTGPYGEFAKLTRAGVPTLVKSGTGKYHHKVFLVDAGTENGIVLTGSVNASSSGDRTNNENMIILHSPALARKYLKNFQKDFGETSTVAARCKVKGRAIAGKRLGRANLHLASKGRAAERIRIEMPPRFPSSGPMPSVEIYRDGEVVTEEMELTQDGRDILIRHLGERDSHEGDSELRIELRGLWLGQIPGVYNFYVSVAHDAGEPLLPLRYQPTLNVQALPDEAVD